MTILLECNYLTPNNSFFTKNSQQGAATVKVFNHIAAIFDHTVFNQKCLLHTISTASKNKLLLTIGM